MAALLFPSKAFPTSVGTTFALFFGLVIMLVMAGSQAFGASQYVVISAEPASDEFPAGKVLAVGDSIVVPENATLTLLGEDGSVVAIPGPAKVSVTEDALETEGEAPDQAAKNRSTLSKLAVLLAGKGEPTDSLGVARGFDAKKEVKGLANPWVLSIHETARGCVLNEPIRLGRASGKDAISVSVAGDEKASESQLEWAAGETILTLPDKIPPSSKELFVKAEGKSVFIDLNLIPDDIDPNNPMAVLGWMVDQGCDGQALAFTRLLVHQAQ